MEHISGIIQKVLDEVQAKIKKEGPKVFKPVNEVQEEGVERIETCVDMLAAVSEKCLQDIGHLCVERGIKNDYEALVIMLSKNILQGGIAMAAIAISMHEEFDLKKTLQQLLDFELEQYLAYREKIKE